MRLIVTAILLTLVAVLTLVGHQVVDHPSAPMKNSSQGHDPADKAPKKEELPRKLVEKVAVRHPSHRRSSQKPPARPLALVPQPASTDQPAGLDDARHAEHLRLLARPVVLQVFRN